MAPSDDYAPALAPNNAASIQVKAPASGLPLKLQHDQTMWTVNEGDTLNVTLTFTLAPGLAEPRDSYAVFLAVEAGDASPGADFVGFTDPEPRVVAEPGDWQTAGDGGSTQTVTISIETIGDSEVEANETFDLFFAAGNIDDSLDIPLTDPDNRTTVSILDDDPLVVTDVEVTSTPGGGHYGVGDTITFTVTFGADVTVEDGTQFEFRLGGATPQASGLESDEEMEATFEYTVAAGEGDDDGISWGANALTLNGGSIIASANEALIPQNANLDHAAQVALPGHKVDTTKPALSGGGGATLTLTFSEELNATAPAASAFTVKVDGGSGVNPTDVSVSGRVVTLTPGTAITPGQAVTVSYAKPTTDKIRDLSGKEADEFTAEVVTTAPPVEVTVTFAQDPYTVAEGAEQSVAVRLSADPERTVVIPLTASDQGDATPADYTVPPNVTFATGDMEKMLTFSATQDTEDDDGESVLLAFGGTLPIGVSAGTTAETTVSITDDDNPAVTVMLGEGAYTVPEGGTQTVTVTLSVDPERTVVIPLTATDQGETTSADYTVPLSVTFDAEEMSKTITFSATDDPGRRRGGACCWSLARCRTA